MVCCLKEQGANAVKFLLYYDVDDSEEINIQKKAYIERIGSECVAEDIPFFLEVLTYDDNIPDNKSAEFAKVKPRKVNEAMKLYSQKIDSMLMCFKVEVPVNMNFVEGFTEGEVVYTKEEAAQHFRDQDAATHLPYIYLSAGVSAELFQETLTFAHDAGAHFNVCYVDATWSGAVKVYIEQGEQAAREWLRTTGYKNIDDLNKVLKQLQHLGKQNNLGRLFI